MRKELEQRLVERWPTWFNTKGDSRQTGMTDGFRQEDGWFDIVWRLCGDLEPLVAKLEQTAGCQFEVLQVKEKFGGLRFYVNCRKEEALRQRIETAIQESFHTCEVCGQPGERREGGWIKTLCDEHARARGAKPWLSYCTSNSGMRASVIFQGLANADRDSRRNRARPFRQGVE